MTTDPRHTGPAPQTDPMSEPMPMGADGQIAVAADPALPGRAQAFRIDGERLQHVGEIIESLPQRVPPAPVEGTPPPYGHDAHPFTTFDPTAAGGGWAGVDVYPPAAPATPYARGGLIEDPGTWAEPDPGGCEYIVPARPRCKKHAEGCTRTPIRGLDVCQQHLSPGLQALREANDRIVERQRVLELVDVDPWRVPADGLLEYDPVHDEWRVEVWRDPLGAQLDRGRIILRRYAGRRAAAALDEPARGRFISMNRYLVGGDAPGAPRVFFGPPGGDDPGHAAYVARWRRVAEAYRKARRPAYDRGRHLHNWPTKPDRDDQVDAMAYSLSTLAATAAPAGMALAELQGAGRRLAAGLGMALERSGSRRGRGA